MGVYKERRNVAQKLGSKAKERNGRRNAGLGWTMKKTQHTAIEASLNKVKSESVSSPYWAKKSGRGKSSGGGVGRVSVDKTSDLLGFPGPLAALVKRVD